MNRHHRLERLEAASLAGGAVLVDFEDGTRRRLNIVDALGCALNSFGSKCSPRATNAKVISNPGNIGRIPVILEFLTQGAA